MSNATEEACILIRKWDKIIFLFFFKSTEERNQLSLI